MDSSLPLQPIPGDAADAALRHRIVLTALRLAEQAGSWDAVHVHAVAREAGLRLDELARCFGDKDAIAEAWFDMADDALRAAAAQPGWRQLAPRERIERAILAWFDALAPHRKLAGEMLRYKFHPEHLHLQARGAARVSRTVQWIRETAQLPSTGWRRELEEAVLTTIYLATLSCWLLDGSPGNERTRRLLRGLLARAERGARWLGLRG